MTKLPNGWEVKKLGDICKLYQPKTITMNEIKSSGKYKVYGANGVIGYYDEYNHENSEVAMACRGATCGYINYTEPKSWITGNAMIITPLDESIYKRYLIYALPLYRVKDIITGSAQPQITRTNLSKIQIPLPPLEEQRKIVKILDEKFASIDESIRLAKVDLLSLDELWQSILNDSFNPLKSKLDNDTYTLPPTWKWEKLGDIAQVVTGTTPSKKKEEFYGVGYPLFKPSDLDDGYELFSGSDNLTPLGFENARQFPINTTLVVCIGATIGKVGLTRVEGSCNQQINAILPNEKFNSEYLYFLCSSPYFQMILKANASQTTLPIINKTEFIKLQIPLPPLKEQERIAKELESKAKTIKELKELYTKRLKDYEELKESLLDLAFKGGL